MPNLVGTGLNQVPTNGMLGGLAYQDPEHASIKDLDLKNLSQINSQLDGTFTDLFVYDTSKDSDGGAWRKRTQDKSWYNLLNYEDTYIIKGSRKDFPSIALLTVDSTGLGIYDGDDLNLSLWMKFKTSSRSAIYIAPTCVTAKNSIVFVGANNGASGSYLSEFGFVHDRMRLHQDGGKNQTRETWITGMVQGSAGSYWKASQSPISISNSYQLKDRKTHDVAVTVLPDAPIDEISGLPRPTIAVAMQTGLSIIRDDQSVISTETQSEQIKLVDFTEDHGLNAHIDASNNTNKALVYVDNIQKIHNLPYATYANWDGVLWQSRYNVKALTYLTPSASNTSNVLSDFVSMKGRSAAIGSNFATGGLTLLEKEDKGGDYQGLGMVAYINTKYNTGYMHGHITNVLLASTDSTNITSSTELITNGTFDSNVSNWPTRNGATATHTTPAAEGIDTPATDGQPAPTSDGIIKIVSSGGGSGVYQSFPTVIGKTYVASFLAYQVTYSSNYVKIGTTDNGTQNYDFYDEWDQSVANNWASGSATFTATAETTYITLIPSQVSGRVLYMDQISVRLAEDDRSTNLEDKKGITAFGSITKSPVVTGSELVGYSGFSANNVFVQPYNPKLNPGTGDYSFICWFKTQATSTEEIIMRRFGNPTVTGGMMLRIVYSTSKLQWYVRDTSSNAYVVNSGGAVDDGVWHCAVGTRQGGVARLYLDGQLQGEEGVTTNSHDSGIGSRMCIGAEEVVGGTFNTFQNPADFTTLALIRYSLSAPTEKQVKKIFEEEKHLFQKDAKCTLYGSSNAVTALSYDDSTEILHVGTSAGRSEFRGLRLINNTTDAVTTAISASNGLVAEQ